MMPVPHSMWDGPDQCRFLYLHKICGFTARVYLSPTCQIRQSTQRYLNWSTSELRTFMWSGFFYYLFTDRLGTARKLGDVSGPDASNFNGSLLTFCYLCSDGALLTYRFKTCFMIRTTFGRGSSSFGILGCNIHLPLLSQCGCDEISFDVRWGRKKYLSMWSMGWIRRSYIVVKSNAWESMDSSADFKSIWYLAPLSGCQTGSFKLTIDAAPPDEELDSGVIFEDASDDSHLDGASYEEDTFAKPEIPMWGFDLQPAAGKEPQSVMRSPTNSLHRR